MKHVLVKRGFAAADYANEGNLFLLGNGRLGYRGTLEEQHKDAMVCLNVVGSYDKYEDKWRESVNAPNPFFALTFFEGKEISACVENPLSHERSLDLYTGILKRKTEFKEAIIRTQRFVDKTNPDALSLRYEIEAKEAGEYSFLSGIDEDVWDVNGPHLYQEKEINEPYLGYLGKTNEGAFCAVASCVSGPAILINYASPRFFGKKASFHLKGGEKIVFSVSVIVLFGKDKDLLEKAEQQLQAYSSLSFGERRRQHTRKWEECWANSAVTIEGNSKADFALKYCIYELLILAPTRYITSIPARGLSGQTYKGAIFWDTEMFILPFFLLTDPSVAKSLVQYRINTLPGALKKAKSFGKSGAFYAWESQDTGEEACSLFNVSDAVTGKPIRTYFADKQIHISGDVALGIIRTYEAEKDDQLLISGGIRVLIQVAKFYLRYAKKKKDGLFHFEDVIGPDEYHERINDNAFTNYLVATTLEKTRKILISFSKKHRDIYEKILKEENADILQKISYFVPRIYLPKPNKKGVIEQFDGYFLKENASLAEVRSRLKTPTEYWGGERGVATPTQIIKQADVVTAMVQFPSRFNLREKRANFNFYEPRTEHGSSLSACMYSLLASEIGESETAYRFFYGSATIDLVGGGKQYAGGIYIGGTHPASAGGAYLSAVYGFAGLNRQRKITFSPRLPKNIKAMRIRFVEKGVLKEAKIQKKNAKVRIITNEERNNF